MNLQHLTNNRTAGGGAARRCPRSCQPRFVERIFGQNDQQLLERLHGEVRIARRVSHPNVCRVYDIGEVDGSPFLSMEYVDGEDLRSLLRRIGRLPPDKAVEIARKLCAGLAASHERGVLHRDLKPANIMIDGRGQVLIMDFGLAALSGELDGTQLRGGTPAYMAPEQLAGQVASVRSDIYALGLVLHEMFTGRRAFEDGCERSTLRAVSSLPTDIDPLVERVILRCLIQTRSGDQPRGWRWRPHCRAAIRCRRRWPQGIRPHPEWWPPRGTRQEFRCAWPESAWPGFWRAVWRQ